MDHFIQAASLRWYNACAFYAVTLARVLADRGYRVTFSGPSGSPAVERAAGFGIETLSVRSRSSGPFNSLGLIKAYRRYALENGVTLVNVHHGSDHLLWALALRGTGIPLVRTSGNQIPPKVHPLSRLLMKRGTAGIITTCRNVQRFYSDGFGLDPTAIPVIHGGVDTGYFAPGKGRSLRGELGLPPDAFVFGIAGRFSPDKGYRYFFQAAGSIGREHTAIRFLVAGWQAQHTLEDIRRMASEAGILDRTVFFGRLGDARDIIQTIDAGVIASVRSETVCRIAMEYMAMGKAVVATDTNVIPEVVRHGESGLVVPARNPEAMAAAMKKFITSSERTTSMGRRGRAIVERDYSLVSFAEKTETVYRSLRGYRG